MRIIVNPWVSRKNTKLNSKTNPNKVIFIAQLKNEETYCDMITYNYDKNNLIND